MRKLILINLLLLGACVTANAQDFLFGTPNKEGLALSSYANDPDAHAVVLKEYGETRFFAGEYGHTTITHDYHTSIKIFDKDGFKYGKIEIPLHNTDVNGMEEIVDQIHATTSYKDDNGIIKTIELDPYNIKTVRKSKTYQTVSFELPNLQPGCVIEYSYHFVTPFFQNLHPWQFQDEIPKRISTYQTFIPAFWTYNAVLRGNLKFTRNTADILRQCFVFGSTKADCVHTTYEISNIPAFVKEDYITNPKNYMSALYFEVSKNIDPYTGKPAVIATDWEDLDNQLNADENIGGQLKRLDFLNAKIAPLIANIKDPLTKAKLVYNYIQKNMVWDSTYAISSTGIRKAFDKQTGNAGDINVLLIAALNVADIPTSMVLVSTRDHGAVSKQYPSPTAFNYVIAEVKINDKKYLLDATDPLLSFGVLPIRALNDNARVLSWDEPGHWIDPANTQVRNTVYLFNLKLQDDGTLKGTLNSRFSGYAAYEKRNAAKKFGSTSEYISSLSKKLSGLKLSNAEISNIDSLDNPVTESFDIEITAVNAQSGGISFNPYIVNHIVTNPFKSEDRTFPVDLEMPSDTKVIFNINYPSSYILENAPQSVTLSLPNQGGRYSVTSQSDNNALSLTSTLSLKNAVYTVDEYQQLRELFDKVVEQEKPNLVFKKK